MKAPDVEEVDKKDWGEFVYQHPKGNIFQTPEMYEVYKGTNNYEPELVCVLNGEQEIQGLLVSVIQKEFQGLLGGFTSRCVAWGGPLIDPTLGRKDRIAVLSRILQHQNDTVRKRAIYAEIRNLWEATEHREVFRDCGYEYLEHLDILLDLRKGEDKLWSEMNKKRRNTIKKAMNSSIEIKIADKESDVAKIYDIYKDVYSHAKHPLAHQSLFLNAHRVLHPKDMILNLVACHDKKVIGAISLLLYKGMMYDWYAGANIQDRSKHPNDLLPWEAMKWGMKNGYEVFDFGGAGDPNEEYTIRDFKKKFGGEFVSYGRYQAILQKAKMKIAKAGFKALKKM